MQKQVILVTKFVSINETIMSNLNSVAVNIRNNSNEGNYCCKILLNSQRNPWWGRCWYVLSRIWLVSVRSTLNFKLQMYKHLVSIPKNGYDKLLHAFEFTLLCLAKLMTEMCFWCRVQHIYTHNIYTLYKYE